MGLPWRKRYSAPASCAIRLACSTSDPDCSSSEGHEVGAADLKDVVDELLKSRTVVEGEVALEDDAVEAREHGDDQAGKLGDEARQRLHGVLLQVGS